MDVSYTDDCDTEVWRILAGKETKDFKSSSPNHTDLVKPLAVRLQPPFPWDCCVDWSPENTQQGTHLSLATGQVSRSNLCERGTVSPKNETQHRSMREGSSSETRLQDQLLKTLTSTLTQLEDARRSLVDAKLQNQCLAQTHLELQAEITQIKNENKILKEELDSKTRERDELKFLQNTSSQTFCNCVSADCDKHSRGVSKCQDFLSKLEIAEKVKHKDHEQTTSDNEGKVKCALKPSKMRTEDAIPKPKRKKYVFWQLRRAIKKMTN